MSSSSRFFIVLVATASLVTAGSVGPAAGEPALDAPATVARALRGFPAERAGGRISKPVQAPIPFSMVGFQVPEGASLEFRTSVDGTTWTPWSEAEVADDEGPDPTSAEGRNAASRMTNPIWVGEARAVQTRLEGGAKGAVPENVTAHLIDSTGLGRSWGRRVADRFRAAWRGTPTAAIAATDRPAIVTRAQWGANESWRSGSPSYASEIKAGFVHHTVDRNDYTKAEAPGLVRGIYYYHTQSNGWSDMGYNFLVDRFGTVYEGRYGGVTKAVIGAHAGGFNTATFGVSLIGSFDNATPPTEMLDGLRRLLAWKYDVHHTSVTGETSYTSYGSTRYSYGTTVTIKRLSGHRDASTTACPGDRTYSLLPDLRKQVAQLQGPVILNPQVSPTTTQIVGGRSVSGPVSFSAKLRPAGEWSLTIRDAAGNLEHEVPTQPATDRVSYDWNPDSVSPGSYRYSIKSPGRRAVVGWVTMQSPSIDGSASRSSTTFARDGTLDPVQFSGTLYDGAKWRLRIFDPDGVRVKLFEGEGSSFVQTWDTPVSLPGMYRWDLSADGGTPVDGSIRVEADFVNRIGWPTDVAAAAAGMSRRTFALPHMATRVVLSPLGSPGHAMAAGPLAGTAGPVLYTGREKVPTATFAELDRVLPDGGTVFVMGDSISAASLDRIDATRNGRWFVRRIPGSSATAVAAAAAERVLARGVATSAVLVGNGDTAWRQALGGSGYAAKAGVPVLLTERTRLSPAAARVLARPEIRAVTVVGNRYTVERSVVDSLRSTKTVTRVAGANSAATAVAVAKRLFGRTRAAVGDNWLFANTVRDDGWARALAAVPLAAKTNAPLLVGGRSGVPASTAAYLDELRYRPRVLGAGTVLGNDDHIGATARTTLARRLQ